jgi:hypothetical protein
VGGAGTDGQRPARLTDPGGRDDHPARPTYLTGPTRHRQDPAGMRGMSAPRFLLGPSAALSHLWPRRMLRLLPDAPCPRTCRHGRTSHRAVLRAR